jgi:hypothetical protein
MIAAVSLLVQAGCGSIIVRYGALRVSQLSLLLTGIGLILAAPGIIALMVLSAIVHWRIGCFDTGKLTSSKPVRPW